MMARMTRLSVDGGSTLQATYSLPRFTREAIRGRPLRRDGGILLCQRELSLEIGNPLRLLLDPSPKSFVLLTQPVDFLRLAITNLAQSLVASRSLQKRAKLTGRELLPT
jgi:hypothetical protein